MQHTRAQHTVAIVLMELMVASTLAAQEPSARPPMIPMAERPVPESLGRVMHLVPRQNPPRPRASTRHRRAGRATWTVLGVRGGGLRVFTWARQSTASARVTIQVSAAYASGCRLAPLAEALPGSCFSGDTAAPTAREGITTAFVACNAKAA